MTELLTSRCRLLPGSEADVPLLVLLYTDPTVRHFLGGALSPADAIHAAGQLLADPTRSIFIVRLKHGGEFVGMFGLSPHRDGSTTEISYMMDPDFWGIGLAAEAGSALFDLAFGAQTLNEIIAETRRDNLASRRLLEGFGFVRQKSLERFGMPQELYRLSASHWQTRARSA